MISMFTCELSRGLKVKAISYRAWAVWLAVFLFISMSEQLRAERYSPLVSFSGHNVSLQTVFTSFEKQTGMAFFYNFSLLKGSKPITAEFKNVPLEDALKQVLKSEDLDFYFSGKTIFIIRKRHSSQAMKAVLSSTSDRGYNAVDVQGEVRNHEGEALAGATVSVKDGNNITQTDDKGIFKLQQIPPGAILEVTYQGYLKKEVQVFENGEVDVEMELAKNRLDEVQVIAYGSTTQRLNTGDVVTIKSSDIENQPVSDPILALEGRIPGAFISQNNGLPGGASTVQVQIRGDNSLIHSGDPLYIIDGVPYASQTPPSGSFGPIMGNSSGNPFNFLNPSDIESISVLKDADATAIYGSRGANGVIIITTKKGGQTNAKLDVNLQTGFGEVAHKMKLLSLREYLDMRYEAFKNDGLAPNPNTDYDLTLWDTTRSTDWQKELIGGKAQYSDIEASFSGGNTATQFLVGSGYHKETTVFPGNWNDRKGSVHFSVNNTSLSGKLKLFLSANYIIDNNALGGFDLTQTVMSLPPDAPTLFNADGTFNWAPNFQGVSSWPYGTNPMAVIAQTNKLKTDNLIANAVISYQFMRGIEFKTSLGYNLLQSNGNIELPFAALDPSTWSYRQRESRFSDNQVESSIIEPQICYTGKLVGGILTALLGTTIEENLTKGQVWDASGFSSDLVMSNILAASNIKALQNTYALYKYNAIFGRASYNWRGRYLCNFVVRRDGSSRFGPDNRFADFYSVGVGWIFSKSTLLQEAFPTLSYGKMRLSYGITGNDQIGDYSYLDLYSPLSGIGAPYQGVTGIRPYNLYTPNLKWEITKKFEIGLETGFFKDRLLFNFSYYFNTSSNQLAPYLLPSFVGFTAVQENLPAILQNRGMEFDLSTVNIKTKSFRWSTSFNVSRNVNELTRIAKGMSGNYLLLLGKPLNDVLLYHFAGVDPITGVNQFLDEHGDRVYQPNSSTDRTVLLNFNPRFYGGLDNRFAYKGIELGFLLQFVQHNGSTFPYFGLPGFGFNEPVSVLNRWRHAGDVSNFQKFSQNGSLVSSFTYEQVSDQNYGDASFVRLKNLSISYSLSENILRRLHLQNTQVYIHAQNLMTFTHYGSLDPESLSITAVPPLRVVTFGIKAAIR